MKLSPFSRYLRPPRRYSNGLLFLSIVAMILALIIYAGAYQQYHRIRDLESLRSQTAALHLKKNAAPSRLEVESQKQWAALRQERDFSWGKLFSAVESSTGTDIALLEFQPNKTSKFVILRGESRDNNALISFLSALEIQPALKNVHLIRREKVPGADFQTIIFEIKATVN